MRRSGCVKTTMLRPQPPAERGAANGPSASCVVNGFGFAPAPHTRTHTHTLSLYLSLSLLNPLTCAPSAQRYASPSWVLIGSGRHTQAQHKKKTQGLVLQRRSKPKDRSNRSTVRLPWPEKSNRDLRGGMCGRAPGGNGGVARPWWGCGNGPMPQSQGAGHSTKPPGRDPTTS
ncbi:hypothetical protein BGZ61DRAFT_22346 [Ilyonectria robusta]|uniref:uncharacterized protein n=1 Tax=Ilyonectria robusta TaxID=1079257 RepID=UPI001E8CC5AD|nr:uncharacterized protein BGZ61DRAFT_22346 [Ilyonectria robusta]KAH8737772.1 hypothetical protein BGZ61DRAFT_22346 [Ilyonectria robusta]